MELVSPESRVGWVPGASGYQGPILSSLSCVQAEHQSCYCAVFESGISKEWVSRLSQNSELVEDTWVGHICVWIMMGNEAVFENVELTLSLSKSSIAHPRELPTHPGSLGCWLLGLLSKTTVWCYDCFQLPYGIMAWGNRILPSYTKVTEEREDRSWAWLHSLPTLAGPCLQSDYKLREEARQESCAHTPCALPADSHT